MQEENLKPNMAKFWTRFWAYFLDSIVLIIITLPLNVFIFMFQKSFFLYFAVALISILYKPLLESYFGATIGKFSLDIKVTDHNFEKINLAQSFKRSSILMIAPILYLPIMYLAFNNPSLIESTSFIEFTTGIAMEYPMYQMLGYLSSGIVIIDLIFMTTDHKKLLRSLHDRIGETYVVKVKK